FGAHGYNEVLGKGLRIGARGSSDQHHYEVGMNDKTICFARELTRPAILEAMRANLCYWVDAHPITLTFSVNGSPMGSEAVAGGDGVTIAAWAVTERQTELDHIELIHDGSVAARENCDDADYARCSLKATLLSGTAGYYYVAVSNGNDHRVAISSPI